MNRATRVRPEIQRFSIKIYWRGAPMRNLALKALAASALVAMAATSAATAADMAPRYTKAPPPVVEVWNWTGFYIGGNAGYSWGRGNSHVSFFNTLTGVPI